MTCTFHMINGDTIKLNEKYSFDGKSFEDYKDKVTFNDFVFMFVSPKQEYLTLSLTKVNEYGGSTDVIKMVRTDQISHITFKD